MVAKSDKGTTTHVKWVIVEDRKRKKLSVLIGDKSDAWRTSKRVEPWHDVADIERMVVAWMKTFTAKPTCGAADGEPLDGEGDADGPDGGADGNGGAGSSRDSGAVDAAASAIASGAGDAARGNEAAGDQAARAEAAGDERADSKHNERGRPSSSSGKQSVSADAAFVLPATQCMEVDDDSNSTEGPGSPAVMMDFDSADGADAADGADGPSGVDVPCANSTSAASAAAGAASAAAGAASAAGSERAEPSREQRPSQGQEVNHSAFLFSNRLSCRAGASGSVTGWARVPRERV